MTDERAGKGSAGDGGGGEAFAALAQAGRDALRALWARRTERDDLDPREERLLGILEEHGEYREFWEHRDPDEELNPFLHVTFHEILEKQIEADDPSEVRPTLRRLEEAGIDSHEAKHRILRVLVLELHTMMKQRREFDREAYARALAQIEA